MITPLPFAELKLHVSIEQVLARRQLLATLSHRSGRLVGPCPLHRGDNPRPFVVDLAKNLWFCFTRCRRGGDVVELVRMLDNCSYPEVARYLATLASAPTPSSSPSPRGPTAFRPFPRRLPLDPRDPFLADKGIRPETASRFETGRFRGRGWLEGCIAVRLHDPHGRPLGYAGRQLDPHRARRYGKWKLPPSCHRASTLCNLHRVPDRIPHRLALVERPWAVMRLDQIAVPALALLGTELSSPQRLLLASAGHVLLLLDDDAGRQAAYRLSSAFSHATQVSIAQLPDGLAPDDLDDDRLRHLTRPLV